MKYRLFGLLVFMLPLLFYVNAKGELSSTYDKNGDGVQDIWYQFLKDGSTIESSDSNYDGDINSRCRYDSNDIIQYCSYDQDFDGYAETWSKFDKGLVILEVVDSNKNKDYDIVFYYQSGVLSEGFKYFLDKNKKSMIEHMEFEYGFPLKGKKSKTDMSEHEFSKTHVQSVIKEN